MLRAASIGIALAALVSLFVTDRSAPPEKPDWAAQARQDASEISFSDMRRMIQASDKADRVVVYTDMIVFEDRELPSNSDPLPAADQLLTNAAPADTAPAGPRFRAVLNYNIIGSQSISFEGVMADIAFGNAPDGWGFKALTDIFFLVFMVLMIGMLVVMRLDGFGASKAFQLIRAKDLDQGLNDVAGLDHARAEAAEMVDLIRNEGKIGAIGARAPKGLLLYGPPGNGKTLLARAMAKEAGVSFLSLDASGLHQMFVGVGPSRVRKAFAMARKHTPCIVFIDEIDAVGKRGAGMGSVDKERDNLINALLVQMDGLKSDSGIFVVAATNRLDHLDPALIRPGRIDRQIAIGLPNLQGRTEILKLHSKKLPVDPQVDLNRLAASTSGMSGADLAALCNEAGIAAGRDGSKLLTSSHFATARQRMMLGQTGSKTALSEEERDLVAWHEAGHAVVAAMAKHADPVEHVTILPTGQSLGHVLQVPVTDRHLQSRAALMDRMTILAAGRAAEALMLGEEHVTTGAASDIAALTEIATKMVTQWGMGKYGFLRINEAPGVSYPDQVVEEIRGMAQDAIDRAATTLLLEVDLLRHIAGLLLKYDSLSAEDFKHAVDACHTKRIPMAS